MATSKKQEPKAVRCWAAYWDDDEELPYLFKTEEIAESFVGSSKHFTIVEVEITPIPAAGRRKK